MASEDPKSKSKRIVIVPRGLSHHGLPKTPGPISPDGSFRSSRLGAGSPPLSPRSFMSLFRSEDYPRSPSNMSTTSDYSPMPTPQFPTVAEVSMREDSHLVRSCPNCGSCQQRQQQQSLSADQMRSNKGEIDERLDTPAPLTKLAHRIKAALTAKPKEDSMNRPKSVRNKVVLRKVEPTHWTEI